MDPSANKGIIYSCADESGKATSLVAKSAEDARRMYLFAQGKFPARTEERGIEAPLKRVESLGRLAGPLVEQKPLLGDSNLVLLSFAWLLLIQPLASRFLPDSLIDGFSAEALLGRRGFAGWIALAAALLHYARIFLHLYLSLGDSRYGRFTRALAFMAPLAGFFIGGALFLLPIGLSGDGGLAGLIGTAFVVWPWVFALRGGVWRLNESDHFRTMLDKARGSPHAFGLLALLSAPAAAMGADIARAFFARWFAPVVDASLAGNPPPLGRIVLLAVFFLVYGLLVYGAFVASFALVRRPRAQGIVPATAPAFKESPTSKGQVLPETLPFRSLLRFLGGACAWLLGLSLNFALGKILGL